MSSPSRDEEEEVIRISIFFSFPVYSTECLQRSFFFSRGQAPTFIPLAFFLGSKGHKRLYFPLLFVYFPFL